MSYYVQRTKRLLIFLIVIGVIFIWYLIGPVYKCKNVDKHSEWYVNDIYMSNQYYYNNLLNDEEKNVYKVILDGIKNIDDYIYVSISSGSIDKVWAALICDHPEMINVTTYSYSVFGNNITIYPIYLTKSKFNLRLKERKVRKKIGKIKSAVKRKNDYEKEKYIYEYLGKTSPYGQNFRSTDQSAYTAFCVTSSTVCAGYGKAAQILLSNCGIDSIININSNHMWNTVKLDEEYYFFDATLASIHANREISLDNVSYRGLNQNIETSNYEILYPEILPSITGKKYNYFDYSGLTYTYNAVSKNEIKEIIKNCKFRTVELKFTNLEEAKNEIINNANFFGITKIYEYEGYAKNDNILTILKRK